MAFVNEYISSEDVEKYNLAEIDKQFVVGATNARDWTIDRARDMYLRNVASGRFEWRNETKWTFYWKGELIVLHMQLLTGGGGRGEPGWSHWKLTWMGLPEHLRPYRDQILADLKEALLAYKDFGIFSTNTDYEVIIDIEESVK